ncbi:hypothetical protein [Paraburkholderia sp. J7]|uniref:hypothetical protein n=1 Tax=Paraburkholderia sp. J7 TaxID=2805438 RepID=UPI002AB7E2BE|nr:hypothetical protein [Paraburkholderia sp. J7]
MNTKDKGNVRAFVQTAEQIGGWVWVISLVAEEPYATPRAAQDAGNARLEALAHDH